MLLPLDISSTKSFDCHHNNWDEATTHVGAIIKANRKINVTIHGSFGNEKFLVQKEADVDCLFLIAIKEKKHDGPVMPLACDLHKATKLIVRYTIRSEKDYQAIVEKYLVQTPQQQQEVVKVAKSLPIEITSTTLFNCHHGSLDEATTHAANIVKANKAIDVTINGSFGDKKFFVQKLADANYLILITILEQNRDVFLPVAGDLHEKTHLLVKGTTRPNRDYQAIVEKCLLQTPKSPNDR